MREYSNLMHKRIGAMVITLHTWLHIVLEIFQASFHSKYSWLHQAGKPDLGTFQGLDYHWPHWR